MKIEALRLLIREKVEDGRLPHEAISRVQSCPADGEKCDACERRITMAQFVVTGSTLAGLSSCTSNASSSGMTRGCGLSPRHGTRHSPLISRASPSADAHLALQHEHEDSIDRVASR